MAPPVHTNTNSTTATPAAAFRQSVRVIGCGVIAYRTHLRELKACRRTAGGGGGPGPGAGTSVSSGGNPHASAPELLARSDIDAVVISAPSHLHADLAIAAVCARKHVYLEKPVATNAADGRRLQEAVRGTGLQVAVGFSRRCHPMYVQARSLIASGALGEIRTVFTSFNEPIRQDSMPVWKRSRPTGGGVLLDLGSHHTDLLRWFLNSEAAMVEARIHSRASEEDEAWDADQHGKRRGGAGYFPSAPAAPIFEFIGERGTLWVDRHHPRCR
jgi:predicted dehydrogenase